MSAHFTIRVPRALLLTSNQRLHWATKARRTKHLRTLAWAETQRAKAQPMPSAQCVVYVAWPDERRRDLHNVMPTVKALVDGIITDAGLLPDDSDQYLTGPDLRLDVNRCGAGVVEFRFCFDGDLRYVAPRATEEAR